MVYQTIINHSNKQKMKNLTLFPLSSYRNKIYGLVVTIVSLLLSFVISVHGALPLIKTDANNQFNLFLGVAVFGLFVIAWSKEKIEDERVGLIRAKAMQLGFGITVGPLISISLCSSLVAIKGKEVMTFYGSDILLFPAFGLIIYLVVFYVGLLFDPSWVYNNDTVVVNIKKNKQFFIIYSICAIILFVLIFLFHKK